MMGNKMCAPKAIGMPCAALDSSRHSIWLEPAPHILRKRRLAVENLGIWEHTGLGNSPATWPYLPTAMGKWYIFPSFT